MEQVKKRALDSELGNFPIILLLQIELIAYVYARSALLKRTPLSQGELICTGVLLFLVHRWQWIRSASVENLKQLLGWMPHITLTAVILFLFRKRLFEICPYSSDPDNHAYMLKAFVNSGGFFANYPNSDVAMSYTSGFMVLNSIWYWLTPLPTTTTVLFQPLLQYLLYLGALSTALWPSLLSYLTSRKTGRYNAAFTITSVLAGFFACLSIWNPTFRQNRLFLEGTARLAHSLMLMAPLLFCSAIQENKCHPKSLLNFLTLIAFCLMFALLLNPAHAPLQIIVALASAAGLVVSGKLSMSTLKALWSTENRGRIFIQVLATGVLLSVMLGADPFFQSSAAPGPNVRDVNEVHQPLVNWASLMSVDSWRYALTTNLIEILFHADWIEASVSRGGLLILAALLTAYSLVAAKRPDTPRPSQTVLSFALVPTLIWILGAIHISLMQQFVEIRTVSGAMLREYSQAAQFQALMLAFIWLVFSLVGHILKLQTESHPRPSYLTNRTFLLLIIFCLAFALNEAPRFWKKYLSPPFATGWFDRSSLQLVAFLDKNVSASTGERVLLSSHIMENNRESWVFASGPAKAVALFGRTPTAFFNLMDGSQFSAINWKAHLGEKFDLNWLKLHRIEWYVDGDINVIPKIDSVGRKEFCINIGKPTERCVWKLK